MGDGGGTPRETKRTEDVAAARRGDQGAWTRLVRTYGGLLAHICRSHGLRSHDTEEVVQQSWLVCYQKLHQLREDAFFGPWLSSICRHECLRVISQNRRCLPTDLVDLRDRVEEPAEDTAVREIAAEAQRGSLSTAIETLPPSQRRVFRGLASPEFTDYRSLAGELQIPVGSIGPTRARGLAALRQHDDLRSWIDDRQLLPG